MATHSLEGKNKKILWPSWLWVLPWINNLKALLPIYLEFLKKCTNKGVIKRRNQVSALFDETWDNWNQSLQFCVCHWEGRGHAWLVMLHAGTRCLILGTYATAVIIIQLKSTANPCEVILQKQRCGESIFY